MFGREVVGQPAMGLLAGAVAKFGAEPFQGLGRRDDDPMIAAGLHHQPGQDGELVVLDRRAKQRVRQFGRGVPAEGAQPEPRLALDGVALPGPLRREIAIEAVRQDVNLGRDEG